MESSELTVIASETYVLLHMKREADENNCSFIEKVRMTNTL